VNEDERKIRDLLAVWEAATAAGDLPALLGLLADDIEFRIAGRRPLGKHGFAASFTAMLASNRVEAVSEPREVLIRGNLAYLSPNLRVTVTPLAGGTPRQTAGNALTVLRRNTSGTWLIASDANLLAPEP